MSLPGKSKRRASSPAQRPGPSKFSKPDENESTSAQKPTPTKAKSLSALAPAFIPRSNPSSGTQTPSQPSSTPTQTTLTTPALFRPLFKSEQIVAQDSSFQARLFKLENAHTQRTKILSYMKRHYPDAQHHMAAWRCLILKDGMTGLEGEHAFVVDSGCCDDGESRGGKTVMDVLEKSGLSDVLVVVSRHFGGTLLGPARFTHIADCARAVCTAKYEQEKAEERASKVADLVAQLREWDTEVTELRTQIAVLDAKQKRSKTIEHDTAIKPDEGDKANEPGERIQSTEWRLHVTRETPDDKAKKSLKPPDYSTVLDPPDVEKAERLLQARRKTVESLKSVLKKRQEPAS
ncbi:hypothetical protein FRC07_003811 [Ceratobasidium sp. 392]|nr:hypothetical protein FRC07_003811 [Ceratobasidium sp. 392]